MCGHHWPRGDAVADVVAAWDGRFEGAGVEPLEEPFEYFRLFFWEADGLVHSLGESAVECCGEEGRC